MFRGLGNYPMADIKFSCPHCQQHIQAESGYAGLQINCPACQGSLLVLNLSLKFLNLSHD